MVILLHQRVEYRKGKSDKLTISDWDFTDFLSVDTHKQQLVNLIADNFLCTLEKIAFVTKGEYCYYTNGVEGSSENFEVKEERDLLSLQKEVDGHIALHAKYASSLSDGENVLYQKTLMS